jgi:signal recognition particle subunit SRP54
MMKNMAGQFGLGGLPGMGGGRKAARSARKGGGKAARGPKTMPAIAGIAAESSGGQRSVGSYETPGLNQLPPGLAGLDQLPEGFDPSALTFPGNAAGGGGRGSGGSGGGKKGNKKRRK